MRGHTPLFLTLILLAILLQPVLAIETPLDLVDNSTKPPPGPPPPTIEEKLDKALLELRSKEEVLATRSFDYEALVDSNQVTFYYHKGLYYPYSIDLVATRPGHNPSYGEGETYLGQVVDSYVNNDSVASTYQVVHNQTLEVMELTDFASPVYESLVTWTEFEEAGDRITFITNYNVHLEFSRNLDTRLYKDFGMSYFNSFDDYLFDFQFDSTTWAENGKVWLFLSNGTANAYTQYLAGNNLLAFIMSQDSGPVYKVIMAEYEAVSGGTTTSTTSFNADIWYYAKLSLNSTHWSVFIYSDSERTTLIEEVSRVLALGKDNYRYFLMSSLDTGIDKEADAYIKNLHLGVMTSYEGSGHYYTEEMVEGDQALALMYNVTIPPNTAMTLELSSDNSSWVNHNNLTGYESLVAGLEVVDLRDLNTTSLYVRVNMTSLDGMDTPRMSQLRLVTVTSVVTASTAPYLAMAIILLMLGLVLGMRMRR